MMIFLPVYIGGAVITSCVILPRLDVQIANGDYDDLTELDRANWKSVGGVGYFFLGLLWPLLAVLFAISFFLRKAD